ncbi:MAG: hypothetical protein M3126_07000 [Candidatus Eremiobacteraeota bacterium]|nr:hypothetical protein [Candidatus Eremiobacteraeota bacterium]
MNFKPPLILLTILGTIFLVGRASAADSAISLPVRHLVYRFTVGIQSSMTTHDSGISNQSDNSGGAHPFHGSGITDYQGNAGDEGTILVDIAGPSGDGGVVLSVSESARNARSLPAATCVVYGVSLAVICSSEFVNTEEMAVVRLVGDNFVARASRHLSSHWVVPGNISGGTETNEFTVTNVQNTQLSIGEQRVDKVRGAQNFDATTNGTIVYDVSAGVPVAVHEMNIWRDAGGSQGQNTVRTFTDLTLVTDSNAKR